MEIILIILFFVFITLLFITFKQFKILKREISYLPPEMDSDVFNYKHILVGENINSIVPNNWYIEQGNVMLLFASSTCAICHSAIEELIEIEKSNKIKLYVVIMPMIVERKDKDIDFKVKYKDLVTFLPYSLEFAEKLNTKQFPTFVFINHEGTISLVTGLLKKLEIFIKELEKNQRHNNEL